MTTLARVTDILSKFSRGKKIYSRKTKFTCNLVLKMTLIRNIITITMIPILRLALKLYDKSVSSKKVPCQLDEKWQSYTTPRMYCLSTNDTTIDSVCHITRLKPTFVTQSPCVKIASSGNVVYHPAATTILCIIRHYPAPHH